MDIIANQMQQQLGVSSPALARTRALIAERSPLTMPNLGMSMGTAARTGIVAIGSIAPRTASDVVTAVAPAGNGSDPIGIGCSDVAGYHKPAGFVATHADEFGTDGARSGSPAWSPPI